MKNLTGGFSRSFVLWFLSLGWGTGCSCSALVLWWLGPSCILGVARTCSSSLWMPAWRSSSACRCSSLLLMAWDSDLCSSSRVLSRRSCSSFRCCSSLFRVAVCCSSALRMALASSSRWMERRCASSLAAVFAFSFCIVEIFCSLMWRRALASSYTFLIGVWAVSR